MCKASRDVSGINGGRGELMRAEGGGEREAESGKDERWGGEGGVEARGRKEVGGERAGEWLVGGMQESDEDVHIDSKIDH